MKKILLFATLLLAACGGRTPDLAKQSECKTLKCHVEASGAVADPAAGRCLPSRESVLGRGHRGR